MAPSAGAKRGRYGVIGGAEWRGLRDLSDASRASWAWLRTGLHRGQIPGLFTMYVEAAAAELRRTPEEVRAAWAELERAGLLVYDAESALVWMPGVLEADPPAGLDNVKGWKTAWIDLPACALRAHASRVIHAYLDTRGVDFVNAWVTIDPLSWCAPAEPIPRSTLGHPPVDPGSPPGQPPVERPSSPIPIPIPTPTPTQPSPPGGREVGELASEEPEENSKPETVELRTQLRHTLAPELRKCSVLTECVDADAFAIALEHSADGAGYASRASALEALRFALGALETRCASKDRALRIDSKTRAGWFKSVFVRMLKPSALARAKAGGVDEREVPRGTGPSLEGDEAGWARAEAAKYESGAARTASAAGSAPRLVSIADVALPVGGAAGEVLEALQARRRQALAGGGGGSR